MNHGLPQGLDAAKTYKAKRAELKQRRPPFT
jgi:hypothetical protein